MDRDTLQRSLAALATELAELEREKRWAGLRAASERSEADRLGRYANSDAKQMTAHHRSAAAVHDARSSALSSTRIRLNAVGAALSQDDAAWTSERKTYDSMLDRALTIGRHLDATPAPSESFTTFRSEMAESMSSMRETVLGAHKARWSAEPLSAFLPKYLEAKAKTLKVSKHLSTLRPRIELFINTVGDKAVRDYEREDFETFRDLLDRAPASWQARFKTNDLAAAIAGNQRMKKPYALMGPKTVDDGYLTHVKNIFSWLQTARKIEWSPGAGIVSTRTDPQERPDEGRLPFKPKELSTYLAYMARKRSPTTPDYWLPLLALYTGARLNELCQVDPGRVIERDGVWLIDLLTVLDRDELARLPEADRLKLKSAAARREIPIHDDLVRAGFLNFVENRRRRGGRLFPELRSNEFGYYSASVSKRLNLDISRAGVKTDRVSFYSLRHNFRDALTNAEVPDRTADRVMGHIIKGAQAHYGTPELKPAEIAAVRRITFDGVDILPYLNATRSPPRSRRRLDKPKSHRGGQAPS